MTNQSDDKKKKKKKEWQSNGGCERCDALDGHLCTDWARPHPNCDCRVIDRSNPSKYCDSSDVQYSVEHAGNLHHASRPDLDDEFDLVFDYKITCWGNAQEISGEVTVSKTYRELDEDVLGTLDDAMTEALKKVEEVAVVECPVCADHPYVA